MLKQYVYQRYTVSCKTCVFTDGYWVMTPFGASPIKIKPSRIVCIEDLGTMYIATFIKRTATAGYETGKQQKHKSGLTVAKTRGGCLYYNPKYFKQE